MGIRLQYHLADLEEIAKLVIRQQRSVFKINVALRFIQRNEETEKVRYHYGRGTRTEELAIMT